ncbi:class I SAM-dependent methyltransferase [Pseudomonadota bacterium]|nr:class I SAM-dependent methyltransferase [Pseudomonadota bacterium]
MGKLVQFVTSLHTSTKREYLARMVDEKILCMHKAKEYEEDYWDGDRRFGYGGYKYLPGRWKPVAESLIETYNLNNSSSILDVGCGKGFLLHEIKLLLPEITIKGFDISNHGLSCALDSVKDDLFIHKAQELYPFKNNEFDLVISLGCLHNLRLMELEVALGEIERVGKQGYIMLESYRNEAEQFNLQCWALTCESFFDEDEWVWLYNHFGYKGDYEFIYFE